MPISPLFRHTRVRVDSGAAAVYRSADARRQAVATRAAALRDAAEILPSATRAAPLRRYYIRIRVAAAKQRYICDRFCARPRDSRARGKENYHFAFFAFNFLAADFRLR
jgi:hypothetical protein